MWNFLASLFTPEKKKHEHTWYVHIKGDLRWEVDDPALGKRQVKNGLCILERCMTCDAERAWAVDGQNRQPLQAEWLKHQYEKQTGFSADLA